MYYFPETSSYISVRSQPLPTWGVTTSKTPRWWFQIFSIFTPTWKKWSNLTNIFQMGWNHQLDSNRWSSWWPFWIWVFRGLSESQWTTGITIFHASNWWWYGCIFFWAKKMGSHKKVTFYVIRVAGLRKLILILLKPLCVIDFKESCPKYHNSTASDSQNLTASYSIYIYIVIYLVLYHIQALNICIGIQHTVIETSPRDFRDFIQSPVFTFSSRVQVEYELFKSLGVVILEVLDALNWGVFRVRTVGISQTLTVQIADGARQARKKKGAELNAELTKPARVFRVWTLLETCWFLGEMIGLLAWDVFYFVTGFCKTVAVN